MKGSIMKRIYAFTVALVVMAWVLAGPALAANITVDLVAEKVNVTMSNTGEVIPMWGYRLATDPAGSATVPGPTITAAAGDSLTINLTNDLNLGPGLVEPTSIVIPGQKATEANAMVPTWTDGTTGPRGADLTKRVRSFTHEVAAGGTGQYQWASLNAGTYLIQSGTHPAVQIQMGLYAVLKVDQSPGVAYTGHAYDSEQVLLFSEIDPVLHNAVATDNYGPGKAFTSTVEYDPKYFLLNGQPYTEAGELAVTGTAGNDILVRFLNAGLQTRVPQLQGAYMTVLAEDGNLLPFAKDQHSLVLPAGKTVDALIQAAPAGPIPVFDRRLAHSTAIPALKVTVLSPNGGETLTGGTTFTVQWQAPTGAAIHRLWYSVDGGATWKWVTEVGAVSSYNWKVPSVSASSPNSLLRVIALDGSGVKIGSDKSDAPFTIEPNPSVPVQVVSPNGGETLTSGATFIVQWNAATNAVSYRLYYSLDGGATWKWVTEVGAVTSYDWTVPSVSASSPNSLLRVVARDATSKISSDKSDAPFTIQPAP